MTRNGLLVAAGIALLVAGLGWWTLQVTLLEPGERSNASGYGQFVLAAFGVVLTVWQAFGGKVRSGRAAADADALTDTLAAVVQRQWTAAATERGLLQPEPLPIRWHLSSQPVAAPPASATTRGSFPPLPGLSRTTPAQLRSGTHRTLHRVYGGLASGRLIIAGTPGTGKSSAAILLLLDALHYRNQVAPEQRRAVPVPFLTTLQGWDPEQTSVREWLTGKLVDIPAFGGRHRRRSAAGLLDAGRVAVFLDGLDEIPEDDRPLVLRALSRQATFRIVLLTRTSELVVAAKSGIFAGAVALELAPLKTADVTGYLRRCLVDPPPAPWEKFLATLGSGTDPVAAQALDNPLSISLVRDVYQRTTSAVPGVDDLLDRNKFPTSESIAEHLLDQAVAAAYEPQPGRAGSRYPEVTARRTLEFLAARLSAENTRDLAWWTISHWTPALVRTLAGGFVGAVATAAAGMLGVLEIGLILGWKLAISPLIVTTGFAVIGFVVGAPAHGRLRNQPHQLNLYGGGHVQWKENATAGLSLGVGSGAASGLYFTYSAGTLSAGVTALLLQTPLASGAFILASSLWDKMLTQEPPKAIEPRYLLRQSLLTGAAVGLGVGLAITAGTFGLAAVANLVEAWDSFPTAWEIGLLALTWSVNLGIAIGAVCSSGCTTALAQLYFFVTGKTPLRLARFLDDARERQILRTVGSDYQFRHATLQDRLAGAAPD
ncbi:hypothetical protein AB0J55_02525 [Amycolatopsis sp. NPDC049688]|uniref:hypothetical protein n=1 Tax=Amycolatopsis sp. NPDC049688 TaxID=3154733 RepID=UPI0034156A58